MRPLTSKTEPCLGVVLAGGRSRRMGRDKAQIDWSGRNLLDHALHRFTAAGVRESVVSGDRPEHRGIIDTHPGQGPLAGLLAVARQHRGRRLLVVPVDMPRLPASWLRRLARSEPEAFALHYVDAPLPFRIDASPHLVDLLSRWLADSEGPRALRHLLGQLDAIEIPAPPGARRRLDNANTPEDLARIAQ